jgi:starch-binding outer membrane protein, SusD/RagB family
MKQYIKVLFAAFCGATALSITSCIQETFPSSSVVPEQLNKSSASLEYMANSLPAFMLTWDTYGSSSNTMDWGYACQMYMREVCGEDFPMADNGYNYWIYLENAIALRYMYYYPYYYYYAFIKNANNLISKARSMSPETNETVRHYLGIGLGYRAMLYLDQSRLFEYRNTGVTAMDKDAENKKVIGVTVPIVTELTTTQELTNNPCAPFYTMYRFIMNDLNNAEEALEGYARSHKAFMDKSVIYGLKTRLWLEIATRCEKNGKDLEALIAADSNEDGYGTLGIKTAVDCYAKVAEYARLAYTSGGYTPLTREQWTNYETGFNTAQPSWMFGTLVTTKEQINKTYWNTFLGYMASEADWGMTQESYMGYRCISSGLYNQIPESDWRRNSWVSPDDAGGSVIPAKYNANPDLTVKKWSQIPAYANLKFRPGSGSLDVLETGLIASLPLMRVEEMYFDYFEAIAHTEGVGAAAVALQDFINTYRYTDGSYTCTASDMDSFIEELMVQRRIEFWGEGINFFDYKRLGMAVTRRYDGSNYEADYQLNSFEGYVAPWMNYMIPETEQDRNVAVVIAPNPSGVITADGTINYKTTAE